MNQEKYTLGLVSVSFRKHSPREILSAMQQAGLTSIEWGSDVHAPSEDTERLRELVCLQKEFGISCSSYGTYFRLGKTPLHELEKYILAAKLLGTDVLRLWCGSSNGADMSQTEQKELLEQCRAAEAMARAHGVTLCMECHKKTYTERTEDAVSLMETIQSPHFRMYWQPFQWLEPTDNQRIARAISPYAKHLHVFNWKKDEKLPLSDAKEEWRTYLKEFSTPRTLLLEFMPDDRLESLATEADALRDIIGGII